MSSPSAISNEQLKHLLDNPGAGRHGAAQPPGMPGQQDPITATLAQLHDVKTPEPVSDLPMAAGWWILAALVIGLMVGAFLTVERRIRKTRYKRQALAQLKHLEAEYQTLSSEKLVQQTLTLLKQTSFAAHTQARLYLANLYGKQWLLFLAKTLKSSPSLDELADKVESALYCGQEDSLSNEDKIALLQFAKQWIKQHKAKHLIATPQITAPQSTAGGESHAPV